MTHEYIIATNGLIEPSTLEDGEATALCWAAEAVIAVGPDDVVRAISRGAAGYLLKSSTLDQITEGIRTVMGGGAPLDAGVARFILNTLQTKLPQKEIDNILTERELEILTLLGEGLVKKEIADRLQISYTTVDTHVGHIYDKLEVRNAPSAVNKAHRLGLFSAED